MGTLALLAVPVHTAVEVVVSVTVGLPLHEAVTVPAGKLGLAGSAAFNVHRLQPPPDSVTLAVAEPVAVPPVEGSTVPVVVTAPLRGKLLAQVSGYRSGSSVGAGVTVATGVAVRGEVGVAVGVELGVAVGADVEVDVGVDVGVAAGVGWSGPPGVAV